GQRERVDRATGLDASAARRESRRRIRALGHRLGPDACERQRATHDQVAVEAFGERFAVAVLVMLEPAPALEVVAQTAVTRRQRERPARVEYAERRSEQREQRGSERKITAVHRDRGGTPRPHHPRWPSSAAFSVT